MEQMVKKLGQCLMAEGALLATAESCTGGWIAKSITDISGSSQWLDRGFVTYSNVSKSEMLGVNPNLIEKYGAVSEQVAMEMAAGTLKNSQAIYSVSVTGVAGPGGGTDQKPVGTVCFGWAKVNNSVYVETKTFDGNREEIRYQSVQYALQGLLDKYFN